MARPTKYTEQLADKICLRLICGRSLNSVCKDKDMPAPSTVWKWLYEKPEFSEKYTRAKQESADVLVEEILDIADDARNDFMEKETKDGKAYIVPDKEAIMRSKLRIESRKWLAMKLKPKKYGDKLDVTTDGQKLPAPIMGAMQGAGNVHRDDSTS